MKKSILAIMMVIVLVLCACSPAATAAPTEIPQQPTMAEATAVPPTAVPATDVPATEVPSTTLTVFGAASLTVPFKEIGVAFEAQHAGVTVEFNFAGSQQLAEQLAQGANADVFASASKKYMEAAIESTRVVKDSQKTFAKNKLVAIYPNDNPGGMAELKDLAKAGLKLDLAAKEVPVGQYSLDFLDKAISDPAYGATFKDDVLANVVSYEDNVKSVLAKVALGEADAGIVYLSDVSGDDGAKVTVLDIPSELNVIASYPIATISDSKNPEMAAAFMDYVLSEEGQAILVKSNFVSGVSKEITITDALDREVKFSAAPQKVVVVGKALFMIADAIYTFPEASTKIAAIGSTAQTKNKDFIPMIDAKLDQKVMLESDAGPEQIAAVQPDCVILKSSMAEKMGAPLEALNIPVVYVDFETPEQYVRDLNTLGILFQNDARAKEITAYYQSRVDGITRALEGVTEDQKPKTLLIYYSDKDGEIAFNVPPTSWMQTIMVKTAGGSPVWEEANPGSGWAKVTLEQIATWNPEVILLVSYFSPVDDVVAKLKADPQWQMLDAVKNDKLYGFATDVYSWDQPDTRWILGTTWVASKLHPDLFPALDIKAEAANFYNFLYGMDAATFEKNIVPLMSGDIQ